MKIALIVLSGDGRLAREKLGELYPGAFIETISLTKMKTGGLVRRLRVLRAQRADIFAMAVERLAWQRGQTLFMFFGALAGVPRMVMLDNFGSLRTGSRADLLLWGPARIAHDAILSARSLARAYSELRQLETEMENRGAVNTQVAPPAQTRGVRTLEEVSPLRIAYLRATPGPGTQAGGALSHTQGVINGFLKLGADVRLISNDVITGLDESKVPLTIVGPGSVGVTRAIVDIHNNAIFTEGAVPLTEKDPPDFIYQRYSRFSWAGVVAALRSRRPLFLEYNGSEVWVGRNWDNGGMLKLLARYERVNLAAAARIFVVSDVDRRNLERAGIAADKVIVNPNGVDPEKFRPGIGGARVRQELGMREGELLVGFVGTFGPWHGVLALAEAIKLIPAKSGIRFVLVGTGVVHSEMKSVLKAEEKEGRVIFTGAVGHDEVPALLDACDVFVSPHVPFTDGSEFFGSPTKLFEYMAMGKGIVASKLGQIAEVLTDEETALLIKPGDAKQMSAAIMRLAESPALRERLGATARRVAVERHTWTHNAQKVLDAYSAWLEESKVQ